MRLAVTAPAAAATATAFTTMQVTSRCYLNYARRNQCPAAATAADVAAIVTLLRPYYYHTA